MKSSSEIHDLAIVGGGLAGLSLAIQMGRKGFKVILFEKERYPFHKVCGEYISLESWDFLSGLGIPLDNWNLPKINQVLITAQDGSNISALLPLGGFGISRYKLDDSLSVIAREAGVVIKEGVRVQDIEFAEDLHQIVTNENKFKARVCCACYGKKSNLDVKWNRKFLINRSRTNYVGVKYHISGSYPFDQIALHNFAGGYCGLSKIEDDKFCLCYLIKSENLNNNNQSLRLTEENDLKKNPFLKKIFDDAEWILKVPVTISQISFSKKSQVEDHILFIGDSAGMITPLCGNGMSMALHASKIAAGCITTYLSNNCTRAHMEANYRKKWKKNFGSRLRTGRLIQRFFGNPVRSSVLIRSMKPFPGIIRAIIKSTHGKKF